MSPGRKRRRTGGKTSKPGAYFGQHFAEQPVKIVQRDLFSAGDVVDLVDRGRIFNKGCA